MAIKLEVRSKGAAGFRRAGHFFGPDPIEVELEEEQAKQVMRESQLFVRRLDGGPALEDERMGAGGAAQPKEPIASGLSEGSKPVPSDKTGGRPQNPDMGGGTVDTRTAARRAGNTPAGTDPSKTNELTPEQKAELERQKAEVEQQKHGHGRK